MSICICHAIQEATAFTIYTYASEGFILSHSHHNHYNIDLQLRTMALETKIICVTLLIMGVWASQALSRTLHEISMSERHEEWMARYGRTYKDIADKERRYKIFKDNVEYIESVNSAGINRRYTLSINEFADQTNEEFKASRNGYKMSSHPKSSEITSFRYENVEAVPNSMDWRKKGAVTPVKDQGQCGKALNYIFSFLVL